MPITDAEAVAMLGEMAERLRRRLLPSSYEVDACEIVSPMVSDAIVSLEAAATYWGALVRHTNAPDAADGFGTREVDAADLSAVEAARFLAVGLDRERRN